MAGLIQSVSRGDQRLAMGKFGDIELDDAFAQEIVDALLGRPVPDADAKAAADAFVEELAAEAV